MTDVSFYHLMNTSLERALPRLLEKAVASKARVVVRTGSRQRAEMLSDLLWTYDEHSFLPHGTERDGNAVQQPIWITPGDDTPNGADIVVLTDGAEEPRLEAFARCLDLFDGRNADAVKAARERWRYCKTNGHSLSYMQQNERGGWSQKA